MQNFKFGDEQEKKAKEEIRQALIEIRNTLKTHEEKASQGQYYRTENSEIRKKD